MTHGLRAYKTPPRFESIPKQLDAVSLLSFLGLHEPVSPLRLPTAPPEQSERQFLHTIPH